MLAGPAGAGEGRAPSSELASELSRAWRQVEVGNFAKAGEVYGRLLDTPEGHDYAEVYYGLALIAWELRDARQARSWLWAAHRGQLESGGWNPGEGRRWQRRIEERLRFIEANFTVRKLMLPARVDPIPPLADPPPSDPVLAEFAAAVPTVLAEELARAPDGPVFMLLPNGSWWVADRLEWHDGGGMEPTEAGEPWQLAGAAGRPQADYEARVAEMAAGGSLGRQLIGKLMIARRAPRAMVEAELRRRKAEQLAAEYARRLPQLEAMRARQRALMDAGRHDEAARVAASFARGDDAGEAGTLLNWPELSSATLPDVARQLGDVWTEPSWHLRAAVLFPSKSTRWTLELPEVGWSLRIEKGGDVVIQGASDEGKVRRRETLQTWNLGAQPNRVDLWFDGKQLKIAANGQAIGPITVSRFAPDANTSWRIDLSDGEARLFDVRVEPFDGF
jgi:hypothetical protein